MFSAALGPRYLIYHKKQNDSVKVKPDDSSLLQGVLVSVDVPLTEAKLRRVLN